MVASLDARGVLRAQLDVATADLRRARQVLEAETVQRWLRSTVRGRFIERIDVHEDVLSTLQANLSAGYELDGLWRQLRTARVNARTLLRECLGFVEGALVRDAKLDNGVCDMADRLLDDLREDTGVEWAGVTILAEGEFFARMAKIIRVRFPEFSVWALPVAAHEFGHVVAQNLRVVGADGEEHRIVAHEIERAGQDALKVQELFSDFFATYTIGPAFACTSMLLRFNPEQAYKDLPAESGLNEDSSERSTHPAVSKRVHMILTTLEELNRREGEVNDPYGGTLRFLRESWASSLQALGSEQDLPEEVVEDIDRSRGTFFRIMDRYRQQALYSGWRRAAALKPKFLSAAPIDEAVAPNVRIADVINAAWLCRLENWTDVRTGRLEFDERALALCRVVAARAPDCERNRV